MHMGVENSISTMMLKIYMCHFSAFGLKSSENAYANNYNLSMDYNLIYEQFQNYEKANSKANLIFHYLLRMSVFF